MTIRYLVKILLMILLFQVFSCSYLPEKLDLLDGVQYEESADYIALVPEWISVKKTGMMFYAGGLVDPHAYIETLQALVLEGYPVVIIKTVGNLAILSQGKSQELTDLIPDIEQWVLGGHSLGAVVSCMDVANNPTDYKGLVLFAGYPSTSDDLSAWDGTVLSFIWRIGWFTLSG